MELDRVDLVYQVFSLASERNRVAERQVSTIGAYHLLRCIPTIANCHFDPGSLCLRVSPHFNGAYNEQTEQTEQTTFLWSSLLIRRILLE